MFEVNEISDRYHFSARNEKNGPARANDRCQCPSFWTDKLLCLSPKCVSTPYNRILKSHIFISNNHEIGQFLALIQKVVHSHCHSTFFYDKIFRVLSILLDGIKQIFSNISIFEMFKYEKRILLFLIENKILTIDNEIIIDDHIYERMHYEQSSFILII